MNQLGWEHAVTKLKEDKPRHKRMSKQQDLKRQVNQKKRRQNIGCSKLKGKRNKVLPPATYSKRKGKNMGNKVSVGTIPTSDKKESKKRRKR